MCCCEDMLGGEEGPSTPRSQSSRAHQTHLCTVWDPGTLSVVDCILTCQGYSWISVSIPPTILLEVLAIPHLQVSGAWLEVMVEVVVVKSSGSTSRKHLDY